MSLRRASVMVVTTLFVLVTFFQFLAPVLAEVFSFAAANSVGSVGSGVFGQLRETTFVWIPTIVAIGAVVTLFVIAVRLRGTSRRVRP